MSYKLDQEQADFYNGGGIATTHHLESGTFVLPLAVNPSATQPPVVVVQAFAPQRFMKVSFDMTKQMTPPRLPAPKSVGVFSFLGGQIEAPAPTPNLNGGFEWQVGGELNFVSTVYNAPDDEYILASMPFIYPTQEELGGVGTDAPLDVQEAGVGPQTGWKQGQLVNFDNPNYAYSEPSYLPGAFFSDDLLTGPETYPN
jgi:hypothetical protein